MKKWKMKKTCNWFRFFLYIWNILFKSKIMHHLNFGIFPVIFQGIKWITSTDILLDFSVQKLFLQLYLSLCYMFSNILYSSLGISLTWGLHLCCMLFLVLSFFFFFFRATPAAYGSSWVKCQIGAVAGAYATATAMPDPSCICDLCCSLQQCQIPF